MARFPFHTAPCSMGKMVCMVVHVLPQKAGLFSFSIIFHSEGTRNRSVNRSASFYKFESRIKGNAVAVVFRSCFPSVHLCDGAAQKATRAFTFFLELDKRVFAGCLAHCNAGIFIFRLGGERWSRRSRIFPSCGDDDYLPGLIITSADLAQHLVANVLYPYCPWAERLCRHLIT